MVAQWSALPDFDRRTPRSEVTLLAFPSPLPCKASGFWSLLPYI
jgi:hypothetical protein